MKIIQDRYNGIVITPKNIPALEKAMVEILTDRILYVHCASNACLNVESKYQSEKLWDAILDEYQTLIKQLIKINV